MGERKLVKRVFKNVEKAHKAVARANKTARKLAERHNHYGGSIAEQNAALADGKLKVDTRPSAKRDSEDTSDGVTE